VAPEDSGIIQAMNPKPWQYRGLTPDDPYGAGWLMVVPATNPKSVLKNLVSGEGNGPGEKRSTSGPWP